MQTTPNVSASMMPLPPHSQTTQDFAYYAVAADQGRVFRKVLETISAFAAFVLGVQFCVAGYHPAPIQFTPMELIAPAAAWGITMIALGTLRTTILIVNGWWPHTHKVRRVLSIAFIALLWIPLTACYIWTFYLDMASNVPRIHPGLAFAVFTLGSEFLIFYAHTSFVYVTRTQ